MKRVKTRKKNQKKWTWSTSRAQKKMRRKKRKNDMKKEKMEMDMEQKKKKRITETKKITHQVEVEPMSQLSSCHIDRLGFQCLRASKGCSCCLWTPLHTHHHSYDMAGKILCCFHHGETPRHKNNWKCSPCAHYRVRRLQSRDHL